MSALRLLGYIGCYGVINDGVKPDHGIATFLAVCGIVALCASDRG